MTQTPTHLRIALDMDGTLADTLDTVFDHLGTDYTHKNVTYWDWPADQFGSDTFLDAFYEVWSTKWDQVAPGEPRLYNTVEELSTDHTVDIVTAQPEHDGVTDGKRQWLDYHNIPYNELVTVPLDKTKAELNYDVYIDDKPSLPSRVNEHDANASVLVRDRPHNRAIDAEHTRIQRVADAVTYLYGTEQPTQPTQNTQPQIH